MGKQWKQCQTFWGGAPKSLQMVTATMKLRDSYSLEGNMTNLDSILKSKDITLPTKVHLVRLCFSQWSCMDVKVGLWRKLWPIDSILKSRDIALMTKVRLVKALVSQWSWMDVRRLSAKELMLSNYDVGEDSWESLGLQGDPNSPS